MNLYDFKTVLFNNGYQEEFLFYVSNFNITPAASGMLGNYMKVQYLCTLVHGESLHQFDSISSDMEGTNHLTVETILSMFVVYFFPVILLSKKKHVMHHGMKKPHIFKVR